MAKYKILRKNNKTNEEKYLINHFERKDSADYYISLMNRFFGKIYTYKVIEIIE